MTTTTRSSLVLFAYDGSELAKHAIEEAGRLLGDNAREALVVTLWQPLDVGFLPVGGVHFEPAQIAHVTKAAEETAAAGASLAKAAGFQAQSVAVKRAPAWKAIVDLADEHDASLIVLGSHGRTGIAGVLVGSVASSVAAHSRRSVLMVHPA
jgi:nucleotide-binding universal stress UspA family protein